ncbi:MAG: BatA and WFA domain-containing protein [Anaerolineales bacterium]
MQLLTPFALGLALIAVPIILLYMLKLRRVQTQVSSTLLWEKILRDKQANTPWQKLKRNLLLLLQLLILAALVFALTRPALQTKVIASGTVVVLLDASASMNATDVAPTRFEAARKSAQELIDALSGDAAMTLILVGATPQTLAAAETDQSILKSALNNAQPSQGAADWRAAFALAAGASRNQANPVFVILSDGGLPSSGLPALPGEARYIPFGLSQENLAIPAFALRPLNGSPRLFAEVRNYGIKDRAVTFSLYLGESLLLARQLNVPAHGRESLSLDNLPNGASVYKAHIANADSSAALDFLPLDDTAFAVYQPAAARRILLVTQGNLFLEQLLAALPGAQAFRALPDASGAPQIPAEPFDLYLFDGALPAQLPKGNLLLVNPSSNEFFQVGEAYQDIVEMNVREHALTRFVDWRNVHILKAQRVQLPAWMFPLIEADSRPLVFAGEQSGRRVAALAFDLRQSDLPLQIAYPILFSNLVNYLAPPASFDASRAIRPGESLPLFLPADVERAVVASPSNRMYALAPGQNIFTQTNELGYYALNLISGSSSRAEYFAVNLFDADESNIAPRSNVQIGTQTIAPAQAAQQGLLEIWKWLAAAALVLLMIEWQAFHRKRIFTARSN